MGRFNYRLVAHIVGMMLIYLAGAMALPLSVSLLCHDGAQFALTFSALFTLMIGLLLRNFGGRGAAFEFHESEAAWITMAVWIAIPLCGTLPYLLTGAASSFTDAAFESFSGFTTTGSSVMELPEELPEGLLVYRAFTQWIGGLGLILFVVAILRKLGIGAGILYESEFSGTQQRKLHPRLARSVQRMWGTYIWLTAVLLTLLILTGMRPADALCTAFSTVSTGGFVTHSSGLSQLSNGSLMVVTAFMLLSGINLSVLFRLFTLRWRKIGPCEELVWYLGLFAAAAAVCCAAFLKSGNRLADSVLYSLFHIASTMSTCGFYLPQLPHWPLPVSAITFVLIIIGASAGSTGGGIKLRRIIILLRYTRNYFTRMVHPQAVVRVKVDNRIVPEVYVNKVFAFVFLYIAGIAIGAFALTLCGCTIPDAVCMASANISNLGPSPLLNNLGGALDYALLPEVAKWLLTLLMLAGRIELFALISIFSPAYWRQTT